MTVILNDNEMSIAPNVGALHSILGSLRTAGKYQWVKDELECLIEKNASSRREACGNGCRTCKRQSEIFSRYRMFFEDLALRI